ncbi:MAG TPA: 5-oxoprolinase subunit PxpA [Saprospiraceae bacterium]|nr:5-oxoprolinase subunit PxpA [Saprospiraceae bacterium]
MMQLRTIDLNCDMGESYGRFSIGNDLEILPFISSCNIACGYHGGDPTSIIQIMDVAGKSSKKLGAHPSYPDFMGFGRRSMQVSPFDLYSMILYQVGALMSVAGSLNSRLHHVKPHGALYHDLGKDENSAQAFCEAIHALDPKLIIYAFPDSLLSKIAAERGLTCYREGFADRKYLDNGTLMDRNLPGSVIHDPQSAAIQALHMVKEGWVSSNTGKRIPIQVDTLCIHGDTKGAIDIAKEVSSILSEKGIVIQ